MINEAHDTLPNASAIIDCFGGIRPMSSKTGIPVTTIQGWKKRDAIPLARLKEIQNAAILYHIDMGDLLSNPESETAELEDNEFVVSVGTTKKSSADIHSDLQQPSHKGAFITAGVIIFAAAALGAVFAVTPEVRKLTAQEQRLKDLESEVARLHEQQQAAMPSNLEKQLESLKNKVGSLSEQAKYYGSAINDLKTGTMVERVSKLEGHVNHLLGQANAFGLQNMLSKVETMQSSGGGSADLDMIMSSLIGVGETASAESPEQMTSTFDKLRQSDPKVAATFKDIAPEDMRAAVMLMGMAQLRSSLSRNNDSFDQDLKILKMTAAKDDPVLQAAIERLAPKAKSGILTPDGLSKQLRGLTGDIVAASLTGEDVSVEDKALARLGQMIKVEKGGKQISGTDTQQRIADAQKMLDAGDVEGAVSVLNGLQGPAAEKAKPFLDEAQATMMGGQLQQLLGQNILGSLKGLVQNGGGAAYTTGGGGLVGTIKNIIPQGFKPPAGQ